MLGKLALGQDIGPSLEALAQTTTTFLVGNLLPAVWNILSALPGGVVTLVQSMGTQLAAALPSFLAQFQTGITGGLPQLLTTGQTMLSNLIAGLMQNLPQLLQTAVSVINQLVTGFYTAMPQITTAAMAVLTQFGQGVIANLPQILAAGTSILQNLLNGLFTALPQLITAAGQMVTTLLSGFVMNLPQIIAAGFDLLTALISGIGQGLPGIITAAIDAGANFINAFTSIDWISLGVQVIQGIINGIKSAIGALVDAAINAAKSAFDAAKNALGIHSPSRLFRDQIGKMIPSGMALGITANLKPVTTAMRTLSTMTVGTLQRDLAGVLRQGQQRFDTWSRFGGFGATVQQYNTFNTHDSLSESELTREAEAMAKRLPWAIP